MGTSPNRIASRANNRASYSSSFGFRLFSAFNCAIVNNTASYNSYCGFRFAISSKNTIANNTATSNNDYGIHFSTSSSNTIAYNTASNNIHGIQLDTTIGSTVANNIASNNMYGITVSTFNSNIFTNNTITNNSRRGILLSFLSGNTIANNIISSNKGNGAYLSYCSSNTITNNTASSNNGYGIYLASSGGNTFANNIVVNNSNGISLRASPNNTLTNNEILSNDEYGVYIDSLGDYSAPVILLNNTVNGTIAGPGIWVTGSRVNILGCDVHDNRGTGIILENSKGEIAHNTIMENFKPAHYQPPEGPFTGVEVLNSSDIWIHHNNVSWNYVNIDLVNSTNVLIEWNTIVDESAVTMQYPFGTPPPRGVRSRDSEIVLANNTIYGCIYSVEIFNANETTKIANNTFLALDGEYLGHEVGLYLANASIIAQDNIFEGLGGIAIMCTNGSSALIIRNNITNCNNTGIYCAMNSNAVIVNNTVIDGAIGIYSNYSSPMICDNVIENNSGWGILCEYAAPANSGNDTAALLAANPGLGSNGLGKCIQYWMLEVYVMEGGVPVADALINVRPLMGDIVASGYTDANGYAWFKVMQDYATNDDFIPVLNPYLIDCEGQFYPEWTWMDANRMVYWDM